MSLPLVPYRAPGTHVHSASFFPRCVSCAVRWPGPEHHGLAASARGPGLHNHAPPGLRVLWVCFSGCAPIRAVRCPLAFVTAVFRSLHTGLGGSRVFLT